MGNATTCRVRREPKKSSQAPRKVARLQVTTTRTKPRIAWPWAQPIRMSRKRSACPKAMRKPVQMSPVVAPTTSARRARLTKLLLSLETCAAHSRLVFIGKLGSEGRAAVRYRRRGFILPNGSKNHGKVTADCVKATVSGSVG